MFLNIIIFEKKKDFQNENPLNSDPFKEFTNFSNFLINDFDINDIGYIFKYLFESHDIKEYTNNYEKLINNYIEFKKKYEIIKYLLKETINDDKFFDINKDKKFNPLKYIELMDISSETIDENDDILSIIYKVNDQAVLLISNFVNKNLTPMLKKLY